MENLVMTKEKQIGWITGYDPDNKKFIVKLPTKDVIYEKETNLKMNIISKLNNQEIHML